MQLDSETRRLNAKISTLEDLLKQEKDRLLLKERQVEEHARQRDLMQSEHEEILSLKKTEFENLKRGFDELHYESENLRRNINQKQEEISNL
jgi:chromosome segregation ATPase